MTDDDRLLRELLARYDRLRREGRKASADELCREHPRLKDQLDQRIAELDEMRWLDDLDSLPDDDDSLVLAGGDAAEVRRGAASGRTSDLESISSEEFVSRLRVSGLLADASRASRIAEILAPPLPSTAEEVAKLLVAKELLTEFQCQRIMAQPRPQLMFGEYELIGQIGTGGIGEVYACRHGLLGQIYALKLLQTAEHSSSIRQRRFIQEIRSVAKLGEHPHIVGARGAGVQDGIMYFVMTLVDGEDLETRVKRDGPLPVEQVVDVIQQAARGLAYAHERQILHRDIKPANLLIEPSGNVQVLDFGLARHREENDRLTLAGRGGGTAAYMSPEQFSDMSAVDERADIYSLGCTLHRLVTGDEMYRGRTTGAFELAHREQPIPDLRQRVSAVPDHLQEIFGRMVAKRPEDRYPSMRRLLADLEELEAAREMRAPDAEPRDSGTSGFARRVAKNPLALFAASILLVCLAAAWLNRLPGPRDDSLDLSGRSVGRLSLQWTLARDASPPSVLDLSNTGLPAGALRSLQPYSDALSHDLRELYLGGTGIVDDDLEIVGDLQALRVLTLDGTQVTGSGLKHVAALPALQCLFVPTDVVLDKEGQLSTGWRSLVKSAGGADRKGLVELGLVGGTIRPETLEALSPLSDLRLLTISGAEIDWGPESSSNASPFARSLQRLSNLRVLRLHDCRPLDDQRLAQLARQCPGVRILRGGNR